MATIAIHQDKVENHEELIELCPFDSIEVVSENPDPDAEPVPGRKFLYINSGCKLCKLCVKKGPDGVFELIGDEKEICIDKSVWQGITVYVDHVDGDIHPVTLELIGKAKTMADKISQPVHCVFMGHRVTHMAYELLQYGVDEVFVYDQEELEHFRIEPYAACMEDFIIQNKPGTILVGGTTIGRSLAPRVAARFRTGLTADCTILDMQESTDLDQIRPAFGGNIMAHIHTPNHRPQFATVRYKIFCTPEPVEDPQGKVTECQLPEEKLKSGIRVIEVKKKEKSESIEDAEIIVVAGRGVTKERDLDMIHDLAARLDAKFAATRPLIEAGWAPANCQIGLSGRTVKPKLIITCGVSGAIQFVAGMNNSDLIMAINTDPAAPIFKTADIAIVGDIYEVIPNLIEKMDSGSFTPAGICQDVTVH